MKYGICGDKFPPFQTSQILGYHNLLENTKIHFKVKNTTQAYTLIILVL